MTQDAITLASKGQRKSIVQLVEGASEELFDRLGLKKAEAQELLGRGGEFKDELMRVMGPVVQRFSIAPNIVLVPDMSAIELTAATKRDLKLTYLDGDYATWDFYVSFDGQPIEGRGKKFEVMIWKPELRSDEAISSENVRKYSPRKSNSPDLVRKTFSLN